MEKLIEKDGVRTLTCVSIGQQGYRVPQMGFISEKMIKVPRKNNAWNVDYREVKKTLRYRSTMN